jgi:hypothetical protein
MKQLFKYIPLLILVACQDLADLEPSETETYVKFFGDFGNNYGVTIKQTADGDMLLLGYNEKSDGSQKSYLIKTDSYGNIIPSFANNGILVKEGFKAQDLAINDNGYYIVGDRINLITNETSMVLVKSSISGKDTVSAVIDAARLGGPADNTVHGKSILVEADDEVIVLGYQMVGNSNDLFYLQYSFSSNSIRWSERINDKSYMPGRALIQNSADFKYNWVASTTEGRGFKGGAEEPQSADIPLPVTTAIDLDVNTNNNNLGGIGNSGSELIFYELDPSGGLLRLEGSNSLGTGTALSIAEVNSGGYIILGTTGINFILIRTDHKGQVTENKSYTFSKTIDWVSTESTGAAIGTSDGGFAIFGSSEAGGSSMMVLIKTDKDGEL